MFGAHLFNITRCAFAQLLKQVKHMSFQLRSKNVALTYPKCPLDKQRVLDALRGKCGDNLNAILVSSEQHADGSPHLHAYLRFDTALSTRDSRYFDIEDYHPNVQSCRSPKKWLAYCRKADESPAVHGDLAESVSQRVTDAVASILDNGGTHDDVYQQYPGFYLMNKRKVDELSSWLVDKRLKTGKEDWMNARDRLQLAIQEEMEPDTPEFEIGMWLLQNIKVERALRQKQLWINGAPGCGKTSLIMELDRYLKVFWVPMDGDRFIDGFTDDYDLIVFDEMKSQFKITWLNQFIVGSPMRINVKGSSVMKTKNTPVIFLSNMGPCAAYKNMTPQLEAFLDRLTLITCTRMKLLTILFPDKYHG